MLVLIGSVAVLLLTLKLVTVTSAYLKDWDARFNHHMQWPVRTSSWSAVSSRSCIPSILTAGRTGMVEGGSSGSLSLGHRAVQRGRALPALPALLSSLSASKGEGRWAVPLPSHALSQASACTFGSKGQQLSCGSPLLAMGEELPFLSLTYLLGSGLFATSFKDPGVYSINGV